MPQDNFIFAVLPPVQLDKQETSKRFKPCQNLKKNGIMIRDILHDATYWYVSHTCGSHATQVAYKNTLEHDDQNGREEAPRYHGYTPDHDTPRAGAIFVARQRRGQVADLERAQKRSPIEKQSPNGAREVDKVCWGGLAGQVIVFSCRNKKKPKQGLKWAKIDPECMQRWGLIATNLI